MYIYLKLSLFKIDIRSANLVIVQTFTNHLILKKSHISPSMRQSIYFATMHAFL